MPRLVAFGELLLRLDAPGHQRLVQADRFQAAYTGGEANVAVALAQWQVEARAVSVVPDNALGQAAINFLRRYGVDAAHVARGGERLGILYVETGAAQRATGVVYDRLHSSFRQLDPAAFDWQEILSGADWLHLTGTAPAAGDGALQAIGDALAAARRMDVRVSFDCGYRSTLWTRDQAARAIAPLLPQVDLFLGSEHDARLLFGIEAAGEASLRAMHDRFGMRHVAYTERLGESGSQTTLRGLLFDGAAVAASRAYTVDVVDRIGAGDAFAAGVLLGLMHDWPGRQTVEFAAAAACLKHTIPGDFCIVGRDEVERLAGGEESGRVRR